MVNLGGISSDTEIQVSDLGGITGKSTGTTDNDKLATKGYVDDNGGGGGSSNLVNICTVDGQLTTGMVARYVVSDAGTISKVKASVLTRPSTDHLKIDVRLNGTATTDSIFTSDTPLEIADDTTATNGVYTVNKTTIDNGTVVANDVIYVYITQIGDDISASDLTINIEM